MKHIDKILFGITGLLVISMIFISTQTQQVQASPHRGVNVDGQKIYRLAGALGEIIDPMTYTDGTLVQYEIQNPPEIIINRWNDLSAVNRAQIESQAITDSWHDITCAVSICI